MLFDDELKSSKISKSSIIYAYEGIYWAAQVPITAAICCIYFETSVIQSFSYPYTYRGAKPLHTYCSLDIALVMSQYSYAVYCTITSETVSLEE